MTEYEPDFEREYDPEFIRNLGARATALSDSLLLQQVSKTLYDSLHAVFSKRGISATPEQLGLPLGFADGLLTQGRRVAGELSKEAPGLETQTEFGPAFLSLAAGLRDRHGDVPAGIGEEMALSDKLIETFALVAENPQATAFIEQIGMRDPWQRSLEAVETAIMTRESV